MVDTIEIIRRRRDATRCSITPQALILVLWALTALALLAGCDYGDSTSQVDDLPANPAEPASTPLARETAIYAPLAEGDWPACSPEEQGLRGDLVADLYDEASDLETLYGLLLVKNGYLIAEKYYNGGAIDQMYDRASATKSFTSALIGVALSSGCLTSVDQKMMDFFPEYEGQITDPRKHELTIRELLQMRGGYPDEEYTPPYMEILYSSDNWHHVPHLVDFPLTSEPGTRFQYSNLTSHILAAVVTKACEVDLRDFAQEHLFSPMGAEVGSGIRMPMAFGWEAWASSSLHATWRSLARCSWTAACMLASRS